VSPELFEAANKAHTGRHRPSHNISKGLSNPLAGVLKCEICGYTMLYQPRNDRPNDTIRCVQPSCKTLQKGSALAIVEERLLQSLELFANELEVQAEEAPVSSDDTPYMKNLIEKKNGELAELESQKSRLHDFLERGVYDIDTFMDRQQNLTARINALQEEVRVLTSEIQKEEIRDNGVNEYLPQLRSVIDGYKTTDSIEKKNALLKEVLDKVTYLRKKEWTKRDEFELVLYPKLLPLD
jgi:site-specific DNA recombinase